MAGIGRIAFLGTGSFALPLLDAVADVADELLVVSQPARAAGRGLRRRPSPVAALAASRGIAVVTPERIASAEARAALTAFAPAGLILAAYGQLVPRDVLAIGERPPLNVHPSLLPRHRGAAPIAGTILAGDAETGVTLIVMTSRLDAGPIAGQWPVPTSAREDAVELEKRLAQLAAGAVPPLLPRWSRGDLELRPQEESLATYTRPLKRDDGRLDWSRTAVELDRQVRALQPWPGAWTTAAGARLHVRRAAPVDEPAAGEPGSLRLSRAWVRVACGAGALELLAVQPAGRPTMPAVDWVRGVRAPPGEPLVLGREPVVEP